MTEETIPQAAPVQEPQKKSNAGAYASILTAAACWGIVGLWYRFLMATGLSTWTIVAVRNIGTLVSLAIIFAITDRSVFRVQPSHLKYFFATGIAGVLMPTLCYVSCQKICSLAVASILLYTAPAIVVLLSAILWKEPITKKKVTALLLTLMGCACVTGVFSGDLTVTVRGILLGLGAGFFYALYSIFGRYALNHDSSKTVTYWNFVFCGIGSLFFIRPAELDAGIAHPRIWLIIACMVIISTVMPFLLYTRGLARVEAGKASMMASLEPVVASLVGVTVFGEPMTLLTGFGVACVLAGVYILR